jgi:hypothetical protein
LYALGSYGPAAGTLAALLVTGGMPPAAPARLDTDAADFEFGVETNLSAKPRSAGKPEVGPAPAALVEVPGVALFGVSPVELLLARPPVAPGVPPPAVVAARFMLDGDAAGVSPAIATASGFDCVEG